MKISGQTVVASAILVLLLVFPASETAITCSDVIKALQPCLSYLKSGNGQPSKACCAGANRLNTAAVTTNDKRTVCSCLKTAAQKINSNDAAAKSLAGSCGISLPYAVSKDVNCSKVS